MAFSDGATGAAQGAAAGSAFGPWGAAIGGIGGGILGWMGGSEREKQERARQEAIMKNQLAQQQRLQQYQTQQQNINANLNAGMSTLGNQDRVRAFMDPQLELKQQAAANANAHAFGTQGKLLSGARMTALNRDINNLSENAYNNAFNQWMRVEDTERDRLNANYQNQAGLANTMLSNDMDMLRNQGQALQSQTISPNNAYTNALSGLTTLAPLAKSAVGGLQGWMNDRAIANSSLNNQRDAANAAMIGTAPAQSQTSTLYNWNPSINTRGVFQ